MRIVVTDTGLIWNHENPYLEQFKEAVLVVCLSGKKVTEKYECFVSPYKLHGLGGLDYGVQTAKYMALESVADDFGNSFGPHEDILFLADNNPETLYPFAILRSRNEWKRLHLCISSPWHFEGSRILHSYKNLLGDLSQAQSIVSWDVESILKQPASMDFPTLIETSRKLYGELLPKIVSGVQKFHGKSEKFYFDFASETYISAADGFSQINLANKYAPVEYWDYPIEPDGPLMGLIGKRDYPSAENDIKEDIAMLVPRFDGKEICNLLHTQRTALAEANHIPFETIECPSMGPCAGTCNKCDAEAAYLRRQLKKIPEEQRIYPQFDPTKGVEA